MPARSLWRCASRSWRCCPASCKQHACVLACARLQPATRSAHAERWALKAYTHGRHAASLIALPRLEELPSVLRACSVANG